MSAHRYWRLINITRLNTSNNFYIVIPELNFISSEGIESTDPTKALGNDYLSNKPPSNAFDKNSTTIFQTVTKSNLTDLSSCWIGYRFDTPVDVVKVQIQSRQDSAQYSGFEIQTASVEYSDDGITWVSYGFINPRTASKNISLITEPVVVWGDMKSPLLNKNYYLLNREETTNSITISKDFLDKLPIITPYLLFLKRTYNLSGFFASPHYSNGTGYISGTVFENINGVKVPVSKQVYCFEQSTGAFIGYVWSNETGRYTIKNLDMNKTYIVIAVDHTKRYGVEGVAYKKAREVVVNGSDLSYPITD